MPGRVNHYLMPPLLGNVLYEFDHREHGLRQLAIQSDDPNRPKNTIATRCSGEPGAGLLSPVVLKIATINDHPDVDRRGECEAKRIRDLVGRNLMILSRVFGARFSRYGC